MLTKPRQDGNYNTATSNWGLNKSGDGCFEGEEAVPNINFLRRDCLCPLQKKKMPTCSLRAIGLLSKKAGFYFLI